MSFLEKDLDQDTKARVVEAAGKVFAEKGFEQATIREICHSARANVAAANYYFREKRQLYLEALKLAHETAIKHSPTPEFVADVSDEQRLFGFVSSLLQRLLGKQNSWHTKLILRELVAPSEATTAMICEQIRPQFAMMTEVVGRLAPWLTARKRHQVVFSIVGQCAYYRIAHAIVPLLVGDQEHNEMSIERLARHISDFSLHAIRGMSQSEKVGEP